MTTQNGESDATVIKKYANRRLYNMASSTYVTLEELAEMLKNGEDFTVVDASTGQDITRQVLTQILFEQENKGQNLLPVKFLRQLIRFYGGNMQAFVPRYLEFSLESLVREQERLRDDLLALGAAPLQAMEQHARRNMAAFQETLAAFNPFAPSGQSGKHDASQGQEAAASAGPGDESELDRLRRQLATLERRLSELEGAAPQPQSQPRPVRRRPAGSSKAARTTK